VEFSSPFLISAGFKAERGFTGEAYAARRETFVVGVIAELEAVAIKGGQETPVAVDVPQLFPNANVTSITATLTVVSGGNAGAKQATQIGITEGNDAPRSVKVSVDPADGIQNAQIRLKNGAVFWTHPGPVATRDYAIPDFSAHANAYLDKYQPLADGKITLQFMVKSDTDGSVLIAVNDVQCTLVQTQSWKNELDSTLHVDRTLKLTFNQVERLPVDPVTPPPGHTAVVSNVYLDAGGQFGADRLLGNIETHDGAQFATVSPDFSLGQQATAFAGAGAPNSRFKDLLKSTIQCTGVAGYFESDDKAEFYVEMQADESGSPGGGAPLAKSNVAFTPADKKNPQPWTFAKFEKPAELKPDVPYWIVVKSVRGAVRLGLKPADVDPATEPPVTRGALLLNRGGLIWKSYARTPLQALLSPVYVPQPDDQTAAIQISIGEGCTEEMIDPQNTAKTISFPTSGTGAPLLVVGSRGLGSLTIANVIQEYQAV
jgi:hypothetical protein